MKDAVELRLLQIKANRPKRWIVMAAGIFLGIIICQSVYFLYFKICLSKYSRQSLDGIMKDLLGAHDFDDILSDELMIIAYNYNGQEPRFFSKFFSNLDPPIYDVPIGNATGASSAAPTFFDPKINVNKYDFAEL